MSDLVGNHEDRFSSVAAQLLTDQIEMFKNSSCPIGPLVQDSQAIRKPILVFLSLDFRGEKMEFFTCKTDSSCSKQQSSEAKKE